MNFDRRQLNFTKIENKRSRHYISSCVSERSVINQIDLTILDIEYRLT